MTALAPAMPLHAALLRRSVSDLAARVPRCTHCRRAPLTGERVYLYAVAAGERLVCELCRPKRPGTPDRSQLVRSVEEGVTVRIRRRR